jgi:hypothetical protein
MFSVNNLNDVRDHVMFLKFPDIPGNHGPGYPNCLFLVLKRERRSQARNNLKNVKKVRTPKLQSLRQPVMIIIMMVITVNLSVCHDKRLDSSFFLKKCIKMLLYI